MISLAAVQPGVVAGVIKEMKIAVPLIAISFAVGLVILLINNIWV